MFPFDQSSLPQLKARQALIGIDFQQEFSADGGALAVTEPTGFVERVVELAAAIRVSGGEVVWVQSQFEAARPADAETIIVSDELLVNDGASSRRGRRKPPPMLTKVAAELAALNNESGVAPDPEAFLSHAKPRCLTKGSPGLQLASAILDAKQKSDVVLTKSQYSAFNNTQLLLALRSKMVMEVFICGSLANVGVYATALDAAGHGMSITIVEDCCGYREESRQRRTIQQLIEMTGCEVASCQEVLETIQPSLKKPAPTSASSTRGALANTKDADSGKDVNGARAASTPDIVRPMTSLRLASDSPAPPSAPVVDANTEPAVAVPSDPPQKTQEGSQQGVRDGDLQHEKPVQGNQTEKSDGKRDGETAQKLATDMASPDVQTTVKQDLDFKVRAPDSTKHESPGTGSNEEDTDSEAPGQKSLCEGDTDIIEDLLSPDLEKGIFDRLREEIKWQRMSHQGGEVPRLVAVQGEVDTDGSMPVYRHPSDESPPLLAFSPTVRVIKEVTEKQLGHPLNHALIQFYRDGNDYISEHSDKTLDIVRGSFIANVSLGAERTMVLRTKRPAKDPSLAARESTVPTASPDQPPPRHTQRAQLPHNSLCRMGPQTNMKWLHAIRQDKRAERDKSQAELAFAGGRISLTFRHIGTFLDRDEALIWGQGATGKTRQDAHAVINGQSPEAIKMLQAFGTENRSSQFDWDSHYGQGFDVLHISSSPRFFSSADPQVNMRIKLMLAECGVTYAKGSMGPGTSVGGTDDLDLDGLPVKFVDNDASKSTVQGHVAIMMYLDAVYTNSRSHGTSSTNQTLLAKRYSRYQQSLALFKKWRRLQDQEEGKPDLKALARDWSEWALFASESDGGFLAGDEPSLADYVVWPVLHSIVEQSDGDVFENHLPLKKFYERFGTTESAKKVIGRAQG